MLKWHLASVEHEGKLNENLYRQRKTDFKKKKNPKYN